MNNNLEQTIMDLQCHMNCSVSGVTHKFFYNKNINNLAEHFHCYKINKLVANNHVIIVFLVIKEGHGGSSQSYLAKQMLHSLSDKCLSIIYLLQFHYYSHQLIIVLLMIHLVK